jgi:hypothetical protein
MRAEFALIAAEQTRTKLNGQKVYRLHNMYSTLTNIVLPLPTRILHQAASWWTTF